MFLHGSESGSGFQISLDPDPVFKFSAKILENCRKVSKSDLSEENLKFMTEDRQKMKNIFNFQDRGVWFRFVPERLDPDPDPEKFEHRIRIRIHAKTPDPNPDLQP